MHVYTYIHIYIYMLLCVYVCVYIYIYIHTHSIYIYIYIYTYIYIYMHNRGIPSTGVLQTGVFGIVEMRLAESCENSCLGIAKPGFSRPGQTCFRPLENPCFQKKTVYATPDLAAPVEGLQIHGGRGVLRAPPPDLVHDDGLVAGVPRHARLLQETRRDPALGRDAALAPRQLAGEGVGAPESGLLGGERHEVHVSDRLHAALGERLRDREQRRDAAPVVLGTRRGAVEGPGVVVRSDRDRVQGLPGQERDHVHQLLASLMEDVQAGGEPQILELLLQEVLRALRGVRVGPRGLAKCVYK